MEDGYGSGYSHILSIIPPDERALVSELGLEEVPSAYPALTLVLPGYHAAFLERVYLRLFGTSNPIRYQGLGESLFRLIATQWLLKGNGEGIRRERLMATSPSGLTPEQFYQLIGLLYEYYLRHDAPNSYYLICRWVTGLLPRMWSSIRLVSIGATNGTASGNGRYRRR